MSVDTAEQLFTEELKDIYSAEKQAVRAYPRLTKMVQSEELKQALQKHLDQTREQVSRLDQVFEILSTRAGRSTCEGMKGLLDEAAGHASKIDPGPVLDAALIGALQRVEHYEIAAYGTVATLAEAMGQKEVKRLLGQTLEEEKGTYELLTGVAQRVNARALADSDETLESDEEEEITNVPGQGKSSRARSRSKGPSSRRPSRNASR